jgi:16S rRNA processing protein RimM
MHWGQESRGYKFGCTVQRCNGAQKGIFMIKQDELIKIGQFAKPHGIKGEMAFHFTNDSFDEDDNPFFICEIEGIFVPFRLEECRFISDSSALVKLKSIDSEAKAKTLTHKEVYFTKEHIRESTSDDDYTWDYFIGFSLIDEQLGLIGTITDINDSTLNVLFIVAKDGAEILVPANEEMITRIEDEEQKIYLRLPDGILDI